MNLKANIDIINKILGTLPEFFYHGRVGDKSLTENNYFEVVIYQNEDNIKGRRFWELKGRTNLDFAFHGFYLTPCEALARKWAFAKVPKDNECYQILKYRLNKEKMESFNSKILIVPDLDWAEFVFNNRAKIYNENRFDFTFGFIADGIMADIYSRMENGDYFDLQKFHKDVFKDEHQTFLFDFYGNRKFECREIITTCGLNEYKNYQLCISSEYALKLIDLVDIIYIDKGTDIPDSISVDGELREFKKYVSKELIDLVMKRGEQRGKHCIEKEDS